MRIDDRDVYRILAAVMGGATLILLGAAVWSVLCAASVLGTLSSALLAASAAFVTSVLIEIAKSQ